MRFPSLRRHPAVEAPTEPEIEEAAPEGVPEELVPGGGRPVPKTLVPRWVQLVVLPLALLGAWALARAAGSIFLVVIFASVLALILNPVVKLMQRGHVPRGLAILLVYVGGIGALGGVGVLLANPISNQLSTFQHNVPHYIKEANKELASVQRWLDRNGINVRIQKQGQTALQTLQKSVEKRSGAIVSFTRDLLTKLITISVDFVLVLVLSVYMLVYGRQIGQLVRTIVPAGDGTPEDDFPLLIQKAVSGYLRGQITFSVIMGASAAISLWIFGVSGIFPDGGHYAIFFGSFYGLMELIPYVGPIIGPIPAIVVALFEHPVTAIWVLLLFVALQQLEGHVVAPQVFRLSLRINPILIILSLLIGYQIYGVAGALIALPVAAIVRETIVYLRLHLELEPWSTGGPLLGVSAAPCPECGEPATGGDAFCRRCGAALPAPVGAQR